MSDYNFYQLKSEILTYTNRYMVEALQNKNIEVEVSKNENDVLIVDFSFKYCLAQMIVNEPTFAPYQMISFEALAIDSLECQVTKIPELIYFFYDSEENNKDEVVYEINKAVKYCEKYIPGELSKEYVNKQGILKFQDKNLNSVVHPDDIKKIRHECLIDQFVCIGVQFQYLVLKCDRVTIRVLPSVFETSN